MPVKFPCPACRRTLKVTRRKIGTPIDCPRCGAPMTVPTVEVARAALAMAGSARTAPAPAVLSEFAVYDGPAAPIDGGSGIGANVATAGPPVRTSASPAAIPSAAPPSPPGPPSPPSPPAPPIAANGVPVARLLGGPVLAKAAPALAAVVPSASALVRRPGASMLLVSRRVVYLQAALIALAALVGLGAGFLLGRATRGAAPSGQDPKAADTVLVRGRITYAGSSGVAPDQGAVVIVLPADKRARLDGRRLHPQAPAPSEGSPPLLAIEEIGGQHARADADGRFSLVLPQGGRYYLLIVSAHAQRGAPSALDPSVRMQLDGYFTSAVDVLGSHSFSWTLERFEGGFSTKDHYFAPAPAPTGG
ncbi:MAG: hypothetical protein HYS13_23090 [Planctomycetia bacterium]|nr:hypothetical protein [Planctomycetia bacterium]